MADEQGKTPEAPKADPPKAEAPKKVKVMLAGVGTCDGAINGKPFSVKRGEEQEVPADVYAVLVQAGEIAAPKPKAK